MCLFFTAASRLVFDFLSSTRIYFTLGFGSYVTFHIELTCTHVQRPARRARLT
jgi:hypothetical protein